MNLMRITKLDMVKNLSTTAGSAVDSDEVDMQGFEGVVFFVKMATYNASNFINAAQSSVSSGTFVDLKDTKVNTTTTDEVACVDVYRPKDRYVRLEVDRSGGDTVLGEIYALQYGAKKMTVSQASEVTLEVHISPAEGSA